MIYFVRCEASGLTKIGTASDPIRRLKEIQSMSGSTLRVMSLLPGGVRDETSWHRIFAPFRQHGEWFSLIWWPATPHDFSSFLRHVPCLPSRGVPGLWHNNTDVGARPHDAFCVGRYQETAPWSCVGCSTVAPDAKPEGAVCQAADRPEPGPAFRLLEELVRDNGNAHTADLLNVSPSCVATWLYRGSVPASSFAHAWLLAQLEADRRGRVGWSISLTAPFVATFDGGPCG